MPFFRILSNSCLPEQEMPHFCHTNSLRLHLNTADSGMHKNFSGVNIFHFTNLTNNFIVIKFIVPTLKRNRPGFAACKMLVSYCIIRGDAEDFNNCVPPLIQRTLFLNISIWNSGIFLRFFCYANKIMELVQRFTLQQLHGMQNFYLMLI